MSYIGRQPQIGNFQICDAISTVNNQAAYTMQVGSVNVLPETANHMIVSLNGVIQAPISSFTVSGSTITFAANLVTGDVINFIQILGDVLDLGVPSDGTVTSAKIAYPLTTFSSTGIDDNATSTAITIDSSENVLVGTTSTDSGTVGIRLNAVGNATFTKDGGQALTAIRLSSDGEILRLKKATTTVGSISCDASQNLTIQGKASSDFSLLFGTNKLNPKNYAGTGAKDNAVDLGDNDDRWKDIYLGGGAFIGGTGTANKLDDYEEGTFTPNDQSGASLNFNPQGQYTKVGSIVHFSVNINVPSTSSSAGIIIGGLPFTVGDAQSTDYYGGYVTGTNTNVAFLLLCSRNSTRIAPRTLTNGEIANSAFSGKFFNFSGYYSIL